MAFEGGEIKTYNASQEIARNRDLPLILFYEDMMLQARTGKPPGLNMDDITDNQRKLNQVRGLSRVISALKQLINMSRSQIKYRAFSKWEKKNTALEDEEKIEFEDDVNDYNTLMEYRNLLDACELDILEAEKTPTVDDDFLIKKQTTEGERFELTKNFYEMLTELEDVWEEINLLMLTNKIISSGIEADEEFTYQEQEQEVIRRITDA